MKKIKSTLILILLPFTIFSATIKGTVKDVKTGESVGEAIVYIESTNFSVSTDLSGNYLINDVPSGNYIIVVKHPGYENTEQSQIQINDKDTIEVNFLLNHSIKQHKEVVVSVKKINKESDEGARTREKNADNVINVVSAKTIERSPDVNVAQVAQRVSGVTLDRSGDGQSQYAIIRGMEQRYNNTLVNGIKIPSPDPQNRFIPLDIIPAELLQKLEVSKGLTPDMEGDGIGGTVNAVMKDAPDSLVVNGQLAGGYNQYYFNNSFASIDKNSLNYKDPDQVHGHYYAANQNDFNRKILDWKYRKPLPNVYGNFFIGKRFFNNKLGVILAASNQNNHTGSNSQQIIYSIDQFNNPKATDLIGRKVNSNTDRLGVNFKLDYAFSEKHKISFYNLYLNTTEDQARYYSDTSAYGLGRFGPGTGYVAINQRSRHYIQKVISSSLSGKHVLFEKLTAEWAGAYSVATGQVPDMTELHTYHTVQPDGTYLGGHEFLGAINHTWQKNTDQDLSGYLNFTYKPKIFKHYFVFKTGGLIRHKERVNYQNDYTLLPTPDSLGKLPAFTGVDNAQVYPYQPVGNPDYNNSNYKATEDISALYVQGKTNVRNLQILTGVRLEITSQSNKNNVALFPGYKQNYFDYNDFLPSLHLKYSITQKQNLRFSVYKAISRPNYYEIVDYTIKGNNFDQKGNINLRHSRAINYDLRYEIYPNSEDVIMAGVFYKSIVDPIEQALISNSGQPFVTYKNFGTATNYGLELVVIKYIGKFGFSGNYTFINSDIATPKIFYGPSPTTGKDTTLNPIQHRPMQGQSKNVANLSLLFRNKRRGFNAQLALVIQGNRITSVWSYYHQDFYQKNYYDLSFSLDKNIGKHFSVFMKLNNLLNTPLSEALTSGVFTQKYTYQQNYILGMKFRL